MELNKEEFNIKEHKHKFAVWAAGRAASVLGQRFKVELAKKLIEHLKLEQFIDHPEALPDDFDTEHGIWCKTMIEEAKKHLNENISLDKKEKSISYGVAAKLINVYLKSILVCGGYHEHEKVKKIHPPIDRLLLTELAKKDDYPRKNVWKKYAEKGWSKFESQDGIVA